MDSAPESSGLSTPGTDIGENSTWHQTGTHVICAQQFFPRLANLKRHRTRLHSIQIVLDRPATNAASGDGPDPRDPDVSLLPDITQDIRDISDMLSELDTDENFGNLYAGNPDWWN